MEREEAEELRRNSASFLRQISLLRYATFRETDARADFDIRKTISEQCSLRVVAKRRINKANSGPKIHELRVTERLSRLEAITIGQGDEIKDTYRDRHLLSTIKLTLVSTVN